ncbi:glycosyltransferase family 39 protein [Candidatus Gottesmanbacteria bacterium]|nr:glycosyltransferase family 39 protein [Candidatus Gottesmanbacteria bacterium]
MKRNFTLVLIIATAIFLRVYKLSEIPVGLHGDEASIGYNAYSLLKTARDQDGKFLPLAFDQFGNFRAAGYHYIDIPFVAIFGLNALAVRLPAALFGAATILVFYYFLLEFFGKKPIALIGSFLLAILPWHINISRASSEAVIASFFVMFGIYLALKRKLISSFISFLISFFFYHAAGPFVLIFLPFLFVLSKANRNRSLIFCIALVVGLLLFLTVGSGKERVSQVSLLNIPGGTGQLIQSMDEDGTQNPLLTRFFHNKLYFYGRIFLTFVSEHLSGDFLFINNGEPERYRLHWTGNLYLVEAPFLIFGFAVMLAEGIKKKKYQLLLPLWWLVAGVVPAALTWEDIPNVLRSSLMIPALMMIVAFGFYEGFQLTKGRVRTAFILLIAFFLFQNFAVFLHNYFYHSKIHEPWFRSAAEEDVVFTAAALSKEYKEVVMTTERNNNLIFHLFYLKFDPVQFQRMGSPREEDGFKFGNLVFRYGPCPIEQYKLESEERLKNAVFIVKSSECDIDRQKWEIIKTISSPDGLPAFYVTRRLPQV